MATYKEVFLTCKRTSADIHERLSIIEAKVAKAQQLAKEQVRLRPLPRSNQHQRLSGGQRVHASAFDMTKYEAVCETGQNAAAVLADRLRCCELFRRTTLRSGSFPAERVGMSRWEATVLYRRGPCADVDEICRNRICLSFLC